jgi:hypothetical protein
MKHKPEDLKRAGYRVNHVDDRSPDHVTSQLHQTLDRRTGTVVERPNLARSGGRPKGQGGVVVHSSMRSRTGIESHNPNWRELSDASSPMPLDPVITGKRLTQPAPAFGMRSRTRDAVGAAPPGAMHAMNEGHGMNNDLGKAMMDEAVHNGGIPQMPDWSARGK